MPLHFRQIEVFRAVMVAGSISGAARSLHVSAPAVSKALSDAEDAAGYPLFERIRGRLYATPEARRLFPEVEGVYHAMQRVNQTAVELEQDRRGLFRLVAHTSLGDVHVPQLLARFHALQPAARIGFESLPHVMLERRLLDGRADLGLTLFPVDHPNLELRGIGQAGLACVLPRRHALARRKSLALAELAREPQVGYVKASPLGQRIEQAFREAGLAFDPMVEVYLPHNAIALVALGLGVALMDAYAARAATARGLVAVPLEGGPRFEALAVWRRHEPMPRVAHEFLELAEGPGKDARPRTA